MRGKKSSIHLIVVISDSEGAFERSSDYSFIFQQWLLFTCSANPQIRNPIPSNIWLEMVSDCCQCGIHLLHLCSFWNLLICCLYAYMKLDLYFLQLFFIFLYFFPGLFCPSFYHIVFLLTFERWNLFECIDLKSIKHPKDCGRECFHPVRK